jgi:hypothetical protein
MSRRAERIHAARRSPTIGRLVDEGELRDRLEAASTSSERDVAYVSAGRGTSRMAASYSVKRVAPLSAIQPSTDRITVRTTHS